MIDRLHKPSVWIAVSILTLGGLVATVYFFTSFLLTSALGDYGNVTSTNLKEESLNGLHLGDEVTPLILEELKASYGDFVHAPDMAIFLTTGHAHAYTFEKFYAAVHANNEVNGIVTERHDVHTNKGIGVGDKISRVKEYYGEQFVSSADENGESITYVDQDRGILLQFVINDEEVFQIILTTR
ncbi:hypothetical protein Q0N12_10635 [Rossellomorea marisflavi]|uniref:hypothetical protein n=1 Tax=Rossellomorea marisflavi TaxID=189381 RepID=UPI00345899D7